MKHLLIHLFFLILPFSVQAQHFKVGIIGGISSSQVHGDNFSGFNKAGLTGGGFVKNNFHETWDALFEIVFVQKGSRKIPRPSKGDYTSYSLKLDYVEVPLLVRYILKKQIAFEAGVAVAALVREKEISNELNLIAIQQKEHFSKTDFSVVTGMNFLFKGNVDFNVRYINSFLPVREFSSGPVYYQNWFFNLFNRGFYNNVLTFSVRYTFSVKAEKNSSSEPVKE